MADTAPAPALQAPRAELVINPSGWRTAPFADQWLGVWAMREQEFLGLAETLGRLSLSVHLAGDAPQAARESAAAGANDVPIRDGVAVVELRGRMTKQQASLGSSASTVVARRQIRAATNDPDAQAILMVIDSPGGTVAGTQDLADDLAAAAAKKPVVTYIEDLGASAAYWVAAQGSLVLANATAIVGSIGTYGVVHDLSAQAAREGVKVHVVRAGAMKGAGTPGTEITGDQLADFQREINALNEMFLRGVAGGRRLAIERVRELADGRVWIGDQAQALGLIDGVATYDRALATARALAQQKGSKKMPAPAATYQEIVAACSGATPEFICEQLKAGASIEQSIKDWMAHQQLALEIARKELAAAQPKPATGAKPAGVDPLAMRPSSTPAAGDGAAREQFMAHVERLVAAGVARMRAVSMVAAQHPDLHQAFLAEANAK